MEERENVYGSESYNFYRYCGEINYIKMSENGIKKVFSFFSFDALIFSTIISYCFSWLCYKCINSDLKFFRETRFFMFHVALLIICSRNDSILSNVHPAISLTPFRVNEQQNQTNLVICNLWLGRLLCMFQC